jgi:hypothetical protein
MTQPFVRLSAQAAIVGGLLRIASSFAPVLIRSNLARQSLYFAIDVCLTVGLAGFWWQSSKDFGRRGVIGLAMFVAGIATVRASAFISAVDVYPAGALITAGGAILVSASAWAAHKLPRWVPLAFALSTLLGVVASVANAGALLVWSGVIFGVAFAGLGRQTWIRLSG